MIYIPLVNTMVLILNKVFLMLTGFFTVIFDELYAKTYEQFQSF